MILVLIAPPGAGKGVLSDSLKDNLGFESISAGEVLRKEAASGSDMGKEIREIQISGKNVRPDWTNNLMFKIVETFDPSKGIVFDGYPRSLEQLPYMFESLKKLNLKIDHVIYLNVSKDILTERALGRRVCKSCGEDHNIYTGVNAPLVEDICNNCGEALEKRLDDNIVSFNKRYETFLREAIPTIEEYRKMGILHEVDASKSIEHIYNEVLKILGVSDDKDKD